MIKRTFEELKLAGQLPSSPGVGMRILTLTQGESLSMAEIGRTVAADPALSGRILGLANAAAVAARSGVSPAPKTDAGADAAKPPAVDGGSALRPRIAVVEKAMAALGNEAVLRAVQSMSLVSANRAGMCRNFDYERFWSMSLARAVAARRISARTGFGVAEEAYTLGLVSSIGHLALASIYPAEFSELLAACGEGLPVKLARAERDRLEIDHFEVGGFLVEEWGLPEAFAHAVQMYELPERSWQCDDAEIRGWARLLSGAQLLAEMCLAGGESSASSWRISERLEHMTRSLRLTSDAVRTLCRAVVQEWSASAGPVKIVTWTGTNGISESTARVDAAAESATGLELTREAGRAGSGTGLRILAVDDDPTSLRMLERVLEKQGHKVTCASDGSEALRIALESNPQVVVADWMMPRMDGIELCKSLRRIQSGRDIFFLLLTGRGEEDRVVEAFDAGVDDYVTKPFNARILMARIKGGQRVIELKEKVESDRQLIMQQVGELGILTRKLRTAVMTDALTELPNRRYVRKHLEEQWELSARTGKPLSLIMIDIDHFKRVNDQHGHDVGDLVLKETAHVLRENTRFGEDASRLGGEEFLVVCVNTTADQAAVGAERIRKALEGHRIAAEGFHGSVTASLGVAERTADMPNIDALLKAADDAVYAAKDAGRNRVCNVRDHGKQAKSA